MRGVVTVDEMS